MLSYKADEPADGSPVRLFELSVRDRARIRLLIGHKLARIEREFILQTLRSTRGNRTYAANFLGISVRSLRDRIRNYREQGENVPEPPDAWPSARAAFGSGRLVFTTSATESACVVKQG
jgi:hypothetical protein